MAPPAPQLLKGGEPGGRGWPLPGEAAGSASERSTRPEGDDGSSCRGAHTSRGSRVGTSAGRVERPPLEAPNAVALPGVPLPGQSRERAARAPWEGCRPAAHPRLRAPGGRALGPRAESQTRLSRAPRPWPEAAQRRADSGGAGAPASGTRAQADPSGRTKGAVPGPRSAPPAPLRAPGTSSRPSPPPGSAAGASGAGPAHSSPLPLPGARLPRARPQGRPQFLLHGLDLLAGPSDGLPGLEHTH